MIAQTGRSVGVTGVLRGHFSADQHDPPQRGEDAPEV
jgi:hypothetical protein